MNGYVDVLSVNWYHPFEVMKDTIEDWQKLVGKPVFFSDSSFVAPTDWVAEQHSKDEAKKVPYNCLSGYSRI